MASEEHGRAGPAARATASGGSPFYEGIRASRRKVMLGLVLGTLLGALDQTVVGTSIPKVVADLNGFEHFAWVFSAYVLAATIVIPIAGKMSDLYGRRPVFLLAMVVFLSGSFLCGAARDMTQLIAFRGLQGFGGGMLFPVAAATIADLYAPSERGKLQGALGAVFGMASIIGPFLGGWIVDSVHVGAISSWRWIFYVNLPMGVLALIAVAAYFPRVEPGSRPRIDYAGATLMTLTLSSLVMVTVWGGEAYAWDSPQVLGAAGVCVAAFLGFLWAESRAAEPMIPMRLFRNRIFALCSACMALTAFSLFTVIGFLPTYMQGVVGITATYSGAVLFPLMLTAIVGSVVAGNLFARFGYKVFISGGALIMASGLLVLARMGAHPAVWQAIALMIYMGMGFGFTLPSYIVAVQNAVDRREVGVASSTLTLMRSLGVTVGTTALGTVLNARLRVELGAHLSARILDQFLATAGIAGHVQRIPSLLLSEAFVHSSPPTVVEGIKAGFSDALGGLFMLAMCLALVVFLLSFLIEGRRLKTAEEYGGGVGNGGAGEVPEAERGRRPSGTAGNVLDAGLRGVGAAGDEAPAMAGEGRGPGRSPR